MAFKMELVIVTFAFVACFAQDISFPENENPGKEGSDNRVGGGRPFIGRPRPGGNGFDRPNQGFQPGRFPQNSNNQGFNPNGRFPQNSNQGFNNPNGQRPQTSNQGFDPEDQFSQSFNQGLNSNAQRPQNFNPDSGFAPSASPPAQTTQGSLRPPPVSSQKIISLVPCSCPFTPEYSPVCGTDTQTYLNAAVLNCFRVCGFDVSIARGAACAQTAGRTRISK